MMWFVEEKTLFGKWAPVVYCGDRPDPRGSDSRKVWRADPVQVPEDITDFTVDTISKFMSPDGEFYVYEIKPIADWLRDPSAADLVITVPG